MSGPLDILFVDDDCDVRRVAVLSMRLDPGLKVTEATSGMAALTLIDAEPARFDLFIFDVMMPEMSGVELMSAIAARNDAVATTPVILMTARAQAVDLEAYRAAGARGIIIKPFDPMRLAADVRAIMDMGSGATQ